MGKAGVVCGIGFSVRKEGLGNAVYHFYWELIARQNWEAIRIDQQLNRGENTVFENGLHSLKISFLR